MSDLPARDEYETVLEPLDPVTILLSADPQYYTAEEMAALSAAAERFQERMEQVAEDL